jgi:D-3-phosphoglycerate dehydrogenase / 2-oxoglutarate reductase
VKKKILISQKIDPAGLALFGDGYEVIAPEGFTQESFDALVMDADAIVLRTNVRVSSQVIAGARNLKIISRTGAGVDNVDLEAAKKKGVAVCNLPALNTVSVAEHTVSLLFAAAKRLPLLDRGVRNGEWTATRNLNAPVELRDKTLGVVGLGAIGSEVAKICHLGLGMRILAYDPYAAPHRFDGYEATDNLMQIAEECDAVTLHVPGMPSTNGMIGRRFISAMKPGAILINCARGSVVDEAALIEALQAGTIAGAALDAFQAEPLPAGHPFMSMGNVILTPHAAALTQETATRAAVEACSQVKDFLEGRTPPHIYSLI